eukprot:1735596-Amphidinium_carterae.1
MADLNVLVSTCMQHGHRRSVNIFKRTLARLSDGSRRHRLCGRPDFLEEHHKTCHVPWYALHPNPKQRTVHSQLGLEYYGIVRAMAMMRSRLADFGMEVRTLLSEELYRPE